MKISAIIPAGAIITLLMSLTILSSCSFGTKKVSREEEFFNAAWKFKLADGEYSKIKLDDSSWRVLDLPHDWSIEGDFNKNNPATVGGGALPGGIGWYRKEFYLPESDSSKRIFIQFDGIYWNSEVYLNGELLGKRPNGYISFMYDLTPYLHVGAEKNVLAVKVDNSKQPNSRWYSGSGIYRNVYLVKTGKTYLDFNQTFITTPEVSKESAKVLINTGIKSTAGKSQEYSIHLRLKSPDGKTLAQEQVEKTIPDGGMADITCEFKLQSPELWTLDHPNLYTLEITVADKDGDLDNEETKFGIRTFRFDREKGFFLNEKHVKIRGVCDHHDLGALGSAVNRRAIERQLEILKNMGCNAIRTSHNPPAPELLDLCDEMGFLVMDETFDMWKLKKTRFDYSQYWDEWHVKDLSDHILRDRNHPCVFLWSIGNEILEQWDSTGIGITKELFGIVKKLDPTREIVTGNNFPFHGNMLLEAGLMDVIGYNYKHEDFEKFRETWPGKYFIATETTSGLMTRGHYDMPSDSIRRWPYRWDRPFNDGNPDNTVSAYDNVSTPWGSTHEESWAVIKKHDYLSGMFIWTGFDYLGEPTPYGWPSRSSYFGIIDLAGFPKDVYYMYKSEWTDEPVLHIFPHWNWKEGENIDVLAYTNCTSVELFLNGESKGVRTNADSIFHLKWNLNFEPGELKAIGTLASGEKIESTVLTAGKAAQLEIRADRAAIKADGMDLSFITINVLDENGVIVPDADNLISCRIDGDAKIAGVDNGNQTSHEPFKADYRKAFNGKCLFIIQSGKKEGKVLLTFKAEGLKEAEIQLEMNN